VTGDEMRMEKKVSTKWWQIILTFLILLIILIGVWFLIKFLWETFSNLHQEVAVAIIAGAATVLVSVFSIILGKYYERKREIDLELREKKIPMYEEFVNYFFRILLTDKINKPISQKDILEFYGKFTQKLMVWGSDEVIKKWSNYRRHSVENINDDTCSPRSMFLFEDLLFAIRKDMGHKNKDVHKGELLGLFVNDIDKYV
jgi:multidrug transporter EmrE-like cation transporter